MFCVCLRQICGSYFYMIYMKISDEGLWELCLKGDMRAFRELYCRFYALLRNYGIKLLPDKSLVEDCVQDIFIKLIQNHETLSPTVNVKGYLLKTLRLKLYDTIEKNRILCHRPPESCSPTCLRETPCSPAPLQKICEM